MKIQNLFPGSRKGNTRLRANRCSILSEPFSSSELSELSVGQLSSMKIAIAHMSHSRLAPFCRPELHVRQATKVRILGPDNGFMQFGGGENNAVSHGDLQLVT